MGGAGGSARERYERLEAADRAATRRNLRITIPLVLLAGPAVYVAFRVVAPDLSTVAPWFGLAASVGLAGRFWGPRQHIEAYRVGAEGEVRVARALEKALAPKGYVVMHDRSMPRSTANLDHIVVGPSGIFTVETKNYAGKVTVRGRRMRGRNADVNLAQAKRQAAAVEAVSGTPVRPVLCYPRATIEVGWLSSPVVGGVRIASTRGAVNHIRRSARTLTGDQVSALAARIDAAFPPKLAR